MKRTTILGSLLLALPLVSAQNLPAPNIDFSGLTDLFTSIFNGASGANSEMIARVLIFLVLAIVIYRPCLNIVGAKNKKWGVILASVISVMAVRFLDANMVKGMLLPYNALGVVLSMLIPFVILEYFFLTQDAGLSKTFRSTGYILMAAIFTGMWLFRWSEIGDMAYYYLGATTIVLFAWAFDGTFTRWMVLNRLDSQRARNAYVHGARLNKEIKELQEALSASLANDDRAGAKAIEKQIENLYKAQEEAYKGLGLA